MCASVRVYKLACAIFQSLRHWLTPYNSHRTHVEQNIRFTVAVEVEISGKKRQMREGQYLFEKLQALLPSLRLNRFHTTR